MSRRDLSAAKTWANIVDAAHRLLNQAEGTSLSLIEVAAAAGVSRATIYKSVGSRPALLAAVFEDQGRLIQFDRVLAAAQLDDPVQAILATVRESCRAWQVMPVAIRRTLALAALDVEVREQVQKYERYRRLEITTLIQRAHAAGALRTDFDIETAAATLALLTDFQSFDHLRLVHDSSTATNYLARLAAELLRVTRDQTPA